MAQTGKTPILIYGSTTASNVPTAGNLTTSTNGVELAINAADGKLYYKDSGGTVQILADKARNSGVLSTANGGTGLSSFTANGVVYASSTSALATGSALTFDGTNLGIGRTPSYSLDVAGTARFGATSTLLTYVTNNGVTNTMVQIGDNPTFGAGTAYGLNSSSQYLYGQVAGVEGMRLTSTGLGIGTSSPSAKLHVVGPTGAYASRIGVSASGAQLFTNYVLNEGVSPTGVGQTQSDGTGFMLSASSYLQFGIGGAEKMRLDSAGNLGLGVTPSAWGSNYKTIEVSNGGGNIFGVAGNGTTGIGFNFYNNNTNDVYKFSTYAAKFQVNNAGQFVWYTAPSGTAGNAITFTQAATLDASGNFLVGTTSLGTSYGAASGVVKQTGGVWTDRGQFSATGGSTTTFLTLANASNNQSYIVSVRQSGAGANFVSAFVVAYGASASAIRFVQDNTNPVLDMNVTVSGLGLRLVLGSGFGNTTWDWVITRLG